MQPQAAFGNPLEGANLPYERINTLGAGAFGLVQLCRDTRVQEGAPAREKYVAIKWIERGPRTITQNVEREVLNHRILNSHPHVVKFREVMLTPTHLGIVMEFAAGGNLHEYIANHGENGRLSEFVARCFFQQLIVGLDYCHRKGAAHRDIKPENMLLDHNDPPLLKLADFGYSKNSMTASRPKSVVGSYAYLAPEVIDRIFGGSYDGPAADVWSCGVTLYKMVVGQFPFSTEAGRTDRAALETMFTRIQQADYSVPPELGLSQLLKDLLARIFVVNPDQRITIAQIYEHPWFKESFPIQLLGVNDNLVNQPLPAGLQSEEQVRAILKEAKLVDGQIIAPQPPSAPAGGAGGGAGAGAGLPLNSQLLHGMVGEAMADQGLGGPEDVVDELAG